MQLGVFLDGLVLIAKLPQIHVHFFRQKCNFVLELLIQLEHERVHAVYVLAVQAVYHAHLVKLSGDAFEQLDDLALFQILQITHVGLLREQLIVHLLLEQLAARGGP